MSKENLASGDAIVSNETPCDNGDRYMELVALKISYQGLQVAVAIPLQCTLSNLVFGAGREQRAED